jgi:hypothetical protein
VIVAGFIFLVRFVNALGAFGGGGLGQFFPEVGGTPSELPALTIRQGYDLAEPHDPLDQVTSVLGPGCPIPPAAWAGVTFQIEPVTGRSGTMALTQFTWQQPGDEVAVYQWYQWGVGPSRLFYATYRDRQGHERVFAKAIDHADEAGRHVARARYPYRRVAGGTGVIAVPDPP